MQDDENQYKCDQCDNYIDSMDKSFSNYYVKFRNSKKKSLIIAFSITGFLILANILACILLGYQIYNIEKERPHSCHNKIQVSREQNFQSSDVSSDFAAYMKDMQKSIKLNWNPPKLDSTNSVTLKYKIDRNGNLLEYSVLKTSGIKEFDDAAITTLKNTAPFKPLPASYKGESIDIQFTFDYNVFRNK